MGGIHGEYGDDGEYPCTMKKDKIIADLCESMSCELNCEMRGCFGCGICDVNWHDDQVFKDLKDAQHNIPHGSYNYEVHAVKFYYSKPSTSKKIRDLHDKINELDRKIKSAEHSDEPYFANHKSQYITCTECGSKINREILNSKARPNHCPVCGHDMRPETELKKIETMRVKRKDLNDRVKAETKRLEKSAGKCKLCWYIYADVYTG